MQNRSPGYTVIELLATLVVAAILIAVAMPSFKELMRQNGLTSTISQFRSVNMLARSEAVKRGKSVSICKSTNAMTTSPACDNAAGQWEDGWIAFVNLDNDSPAVVDAGETVLKVSSSLKSAYTLRSLSSGAVSVSYSSTGEIDIGEIFMLCDSADPAYARAVFIGTNGRISLSERSGSGVPLDHSGAEITACTL